MRKLLVLTAALSMGVSLQAAVPQSITEMVEAGEFSQVESLLKNKQEFSAYEKDSVLSIMERIRRDFRVPFVDGVRQIQEKYPHVTEELISVWEKNNYIETKVIDGQKYMFRKSVSNLERLVPELSGMKRAEERSAVELYAGCARAAIADCGGELFLSKPQRVTVKFTIDVNADVVPVGEKIRVWMPYPLESVRQRNVRLISSSDDVTMSDGSIHNSLYMERCAESGKPAHFEAVYSYDVYAQFFSREYLLSHLKPYDKTSELYRRYTADEAPQIYLTPQMKRQAALIVGRETNPVKQASLIYDWINAHFPWAGAREYSTIPNLAQYTYERGYGDCGQVSLLYITLLRSVGIPARWESGWMLHPGREGMHDWAEVYYEGIGWVPVDMSFGLLEVDDTLDVVNFYKSGIDNYRMAVNRGVGGCFSPKKDYVRSETVDFQLGEVEWKGGNLFYYQGWTPSFEILRIDKAVD